LATENPQEGLKSAGNRRREGLCEGQRAKTAHGSILPWVSRFGRSRNRGVPRHESVQSSVRHPCSCECHSRDNGYQRDLAWSGTRKPINRIRGVPRGETSTVFWSIGTRMGDGEVDGTSSLSQWVLVGLFTMRLGVECLRNSDPTNSRLPTPRHPRWNAGVGRR